MIDEGERRNLSIIRQNIHTNKTMFEILKELADSKGIKND